MSPRPYRSSQRQASTEQTRIRIIAAARELLIHSDGFSGFSIDAVARQADVARMTVYYQFGSKIGLLEALTDALATRGGMQQLPMAFSRSDPLEALNTYIEIFSRFWGDDRLATRRLRALALLDPDFEQVIEGRNERRRQGIRVLVGRLAQQYGEPAQKTFDEVCDILYMLLSFESFDSLAGSTRSPEEVTLIIQQLAHDTLNRLKVSQ